MINIIEIKVSSTGFVSGQAYETINYNGTIDSRSVKIVCSNLSYDGKRILKISSERIQRSTMISLDSNNIVTIPVEYIATASDKLWLTFLIQSLTDSKILFTSQKFYLKLSAGSSGRDPATETSANFFVSVDTIDDRNSLPEASLVNGKVVRVNKDSNGNTTYYSWDSEKETWKTETFGVSINSVDDIKGLDDAIDSAVKEAVKSEVLDNTGITEVLSWKQIGDLDEKV